MINYTGTVDIIPSVLHHIASGPGDVAIGVNEPPSENRYNLALQ